MEELRAKRPDGGLDHVILNDNVGVVPQMFCLRKVPARGGGLRGANPSGFKSSPGRGVHAIIC